MVQLSFSIRVSTTVKSVHLIGSWDKYQRHLPLALDKNTSKSAWKATLRFHGDLVQPGKRYWYYYLVDGYHCSHNPSEPSTAEPTTGRVLNILDVPQLKSSKKSSSSSSSKKSSSSSSSSSKKSKKSTSSVSSSDEYESLSRHRRSRKSTLSSSSSRRDKPDKSVAPWCNMSVEIPKGRPLSVSQIKSPKPVSPNATRLILDEAFGPDAGIDALALQLGAVELGAPDTSQPEYYDSEDEFLDSPMTNIMTEFDVDSMPLTSPVSSPMSSSEDLSYSSGYSTPEPDYLSSSLSSSVDAVAPSKRKGSPCVCERYGITRDGRRIQLDCRGLRCGAFGKRSPSSASASSSSTSSRSVSPADRHSLDSSTDNSSDATSSSDESASSCSSAESDDDELAMTAMPAAAKKAAHSRKAASGTKAVKVLDMSAAAVAAVAAATDPTMSPMAVRHHAIYLH